MRSIAAIISIPLVVGCGCGLLLPAPPATSIPVVLTVCAIVSAWSVYRSAPRLLVLAVGAAFLSGGTLLSAVEWQRAWHPPLRVEFERLAEVERAEGARDHRRRPLDDEASATIVGVLNADASPGPNGVSLDLAVERVGDTACGAAPPGCGGVLITVVGSLTGEAMGEWRAGRRVRLPALLRRPARYLDPGVPDAERVLARRGITLVGTVKSAALVEVIAHGGRFSETIAAARALSRRVLADAVGHWSAQSSAIVAAIVIGDRSTLDDAVRQRLQEAGTYHVIAISGGNIAILAGLILGGFKLAGWLGRTAMIAAIGLLLAYAAFVGRGASVDRATLMATLYFGGRVFDQRGSPCNALAVAAALLVVGAPMSTADPAFLLTFGATLGIVTLVPVFDRPGRLRVVRAMLLASAAAEVVLFPIGAELFSRVTLAGLALNFLAIPLMGVAQIAGMSVLPLRILSPDVARAAGWVAHLGASGLVESANLVRFVPAVSWRLAPPALTLCAVYYVSLAGAWIGWRRARGAGGGRRAPWRWLQPGCTAGALAATLCILSRPATLFSDRGDGRLHVTFIDVGQGDAAFIAFPRGSTLLVDAGGLGFASSFDIGDRVVAPVIRAAGVRRLDRVALTHGDPDHIGGALSIIREFRPKEVWEGIPVPRSEPMTALRLETERQGATWANVHAGDAVTIDGVQVAALHPAREDWERQKVRNDDSLVLELQWQDVSVVLTGDIGRIPEQRLARSFAPARVRIVKVPHHGSLTSSTAAFIAALAPTIAVVSAGRSNHYGHPAPEVIERYRGAGAKVFRTDVDGAVRVETDGHAVSVRTFTGDTKTRNGPW